MSEYEILRRTALAYAIIMTVGPLLGLIAFLGLLLFA